MAGSACGSASRTSKRIRKAMQPHLFNDANPPDVLPAALGDLGGAIGAALLAKPARRVGGAPSRGLRQAPDRPPAAARVRR